MCYRQMTIVVLAVLVLSFAGCTPAFYRQQADREVYDLIAQAAFETDASLDRTSLQPASHSRMYDRTCPDHPPLPPDDPVAHRRMHTVDCKPGYPCWHRHGDTEHVENERWSTLLPTSDDNQFVLNADAAVQLGLIHSPAYQSNLEDLYLSALDVTLERFRFDTQLFAGQGVVFTADGPLRGGGESRSDLDLSTRGVRAEKLFSTGAELVVGLANSLVWQFSGSNTNTSSTLIDFSLVQPLLRNAGRDRILERLTDVERGLLTNVRQMERFRRGFYIELITGRSAGPGPSRGGAIPSASATGSTGAGGFLGMLRTQQLIRNQEANIAALRSSIGQLEAFFEAGRIDFFQVELARQALFNGQSQLLSLRNNYQRSLDTYKLQLGMPPDVPLKIEDSFLALFNLIDPEIVPVQNQLADIQRDAGVAILAMIPEPPQEEGALPQRVDRRSIVWNDDVSMELNRILHHLEMLEDVRQRVLNRHLPRAEKDLKNLKQMLPKRRRELKRLTQQMRSGKSDRSEAPYSNRADVDPEIVDVAELDELPIRLEKTLVDVTGRVEMSAKETTQLQEAVEHLLQVGSQTDPKELYDQLEQKVFSTLPDLITEMSASVLELLLVQARARTESIMLLPIDLDSQAAFEVAQNHRRDLLIAKANLVDSWRQINFTADNLESTLDIVFNGDLSTVGNNVAKFQSPTGRLQVGLEFDSPLMRLEERNTYREALINYQRARRNYYRFEDQIHLGLRSLLRNVELSQLNFELRRAAVNVAISQVELTQLRLQQPPRPNESASFGATTARDLVTSLSGLLSSQNDFLGIWVDYEVTRRTLDFDLGTMRLTTDGAWIDPGQIEPGFGQSNDNEPLVEESFNVESDGRLKATETK